MTQKDKKPILIAFILVLALMLICVGGLLSIVALNKFIESNNYVLCNVYDLKKSNDILYGNKDITQTYIEKTKFNVTISADYGN